MLFWSYSSFLSWVLDPETIIRYYDCKKSKTSNVWDKHKKPTNPKDSQECLGPIFKRIFIFRPSPPKKILILPSNGIRITHDFVFFALLNVCVAVANKSQNQVHEGEGLDFFGFTLGFFQLHSYM